MKASCLKPAIGHSLIPAMLRFAPLDFYTAQALLHKSVSVDGLLYRYFQRFQKNPARMVCVIRTLYCTPRRAAFLAGSKVILWRRLTYALDYGGLAPQHRIKCRTHVFDHQVLGKFCLV